MNLSKRIWDRLGRRREEEQLDTDITLCRLKMSYKLMSKIRILEVVNNWRRCQVVTLLKSKLVINKKILRKLKNLKFKRGILAILLI